MAMTLNDKFSVHWDGTQWVLNETLKTRSAKDKTKDGKPRVQSRYFGTLDGALRRFLDLSMRDAPDIESAVRAIGAALAEVKSMPMVMP